MEIIKRNWKIKLLSLFIAIVLWVFIIANENPTVNTRISSIPIIYENLDKLDQKGLILNQDITKNLDVSVSGKRSNIISLTPQHIIISADLSNIKEGRNKVSLSYTLPEGIKLEDAPKTMDVNIEKIITKDFIVKVKNESKLQADYILESTKVTPEKITVKGSRSNIDSIKNIFVKLDLSNLDSDITLNKEIYAENSDGEQVEGLVFGQEFVNINALVSKQKEVSITISKKGNVPSGYKFIDSKLSKSKVYIKGPKNVIDNIKSIKTEDIDLSNITESKKIDVKLSLPTDVVLVDSNTNYTVDISVKKLETAKEVKE
ncbi:CdaR family protein [Helcococcus ovis]|nr:CdaR family protein [Helcococcus ovis]WNZ00701.1 CdaR family protein [Helcococcus ovis]